MHDTYHTGALRPAQGTDFERGAGRFRRGGVDSRDSDKPESESLPASNLSGDLVDGKQLGLPSEQE